MNNVCIIPARGGSKRIHRKNIRLFSGKPIISYSIEAAVNSRLFERVIVSTDDEEIAEIARKYGAEVPFIRPKELANDYVGTIDVVGHAVHWLWEHDYKPSYVCCIYATAPFVREEDLVSGLELLKSSQSKYVFSATPFPAPIFRCFKKGEEGGVEMLYPEHFMTRSQDLPEYYHDAAQFYWGLPNAWVEGAIMFDSHSEILELPRMRVQDIDTEDDWNVAELLYETIIGRS